MIMIPAEDVELEGELVVPPETKGLIIFAHGSGSSRHSPRNKFVAQELNKKSFATLLVNLLAEQEETDYQVRFNIALLAKRFEAITNWAKQDERTNHLALGYFGSSAGAAISIIAADAVGDSAKAIVSRSGRLNLAYDTVDTLKVPTLLIAGQEDYEVLEVNKTTFKRLNCKKDLIIVPNATHLFEEPGALDRVAELAISWFSDNLNS